VQSEGERPGRKTARKNICKVDKESKGSGLVTKRNGTKGGNETCSLT